ncbi:MAG: transposase [Candidatus Margulisbacteria bacterium]|nr:transposase [Candidatus Margulisiibacteriota bacterium]
MAKKNRSYTKEFKDSVFKRLDQNETVTSLSDELNISKSTIYQWVRTHNKKRKNNSINLKSKSNWTSEDKFQVVLETSSLTETELAEYCRRKGIYVDEVKTWREQCLKANQSTTEDSKELKDSLKAEKELNKELRRELRHKEKALAETAALLVLRKKANAIWGDPEED